MPYVEKRTVGAFIDLERMISFPVNCRVSHSECRERMLPYALDNWIVLVSCFHYELSALRLPLEKRWLKFHVGQQDLSNAHLQIALS